MSPAQEKREDRRIGQWFAIGLTAVAALVAMVFSVAALVGGSGQASPIAAAAPVAAAVAEPTAVTVAMHDPGCHWFSVNGKFTKTQTVRGPVALANSDEATLIVVGQAGTKMDPVGQKVTLPSGTYRINMVGQAPDDNTLKLTVE